MCVELHAQLLRDPEDQPGPLVTCTGNTGRSPVLTVDLVPWLRHCGFGAHYVLGVVCTTVTDAIEEVPLAVG